MGLGFQSTLILVVGLAWAVSPRSSCFPRGSGRSGGSGGGSEHEGLRKGDERWVIRYLPSTPRPRPRPRNTGPIENELTTTSRGLAAPAFRTLAHNLPPVIPSLLPTDLPPSNDQYDASLQSISLQGPEMENIILQPRLGSEEQKPSRGWAWALSRGHILW